jgi:hypothetical protein
MRISLVFALVGVLRMFSGVECGHLPELRKLALSREASLLHNVPDILSKTTWKLVKHWWTKHGLPYCMQKLEENRVSFTIIRFARRRWVIIFY